jgi:hypothetical protein
MVDKKKLGSENTVDGNLVRKTFRIEDTVE